MSRFLRVWLVFVAGLALLTGLSGLVLLPGWLLLRAGWPAWVGLLVTLLIASLLWTWALLTPRSTRLGAWLLRLTADRSSPSRGSAASAAPRRAK